MAQPSRRTSVDDYPYDACASSDRLDGLERLRTIEDRRLAGYLYVLHVQAERNSQPRVKPNKVAPNLDKVRQEAERALAGECGPDAKELAAYLLLDDAGRQRFDAQPLKVFAEGLRELRRGER